MLSNFFADIAPGSRLTAKSNDKEVLNICQNLKYTCCNMSNISKLIDQLKDSLSYMQYEFDKINSMLERALSIADETYKIFLSELSDADIKCYEDINAKFYKDKLDYFKNSIKAKQMLEKQETRYSYFHSRSFQRFLKLKKLIGPYKKKMEKLLKDRKKFYSSFVCSMCSPSFSKVFTKQENGIFNLEVNKFLCQRLLKKRILFKNSLYIYRYLQDMVNLMYCVRKNSKKEKMDYDDLSWEKHNIESFDTDIIPDYISRRRKCLMEPNAFILNKVKDVDCKKACKHSLKLFSTKTDKLGKYIKIENDIVQMFYTKGVDKEKTKNRFKEKMDAYYEYKHNALDKGILYYSDKDKSLRIQILRLEKDRIVDFKKMELSISKHIGLNVVNTPMDKMYYENVPAFVNQMIIGLMVILMAKFNN
jgi:hypothetical protein